MKVRTSLLDGRTTVVEIEDGDKGPLVKMLDNRGHGYAVFGEGIEEPLCLCRFGFQASGKQVGERAPPLPGATGDIASGAAAVPALASAMRQALGATAPVGAVGSTCTSPRSSNGFTTRFWPTPGVKDAATGLVKETVRANTETGGFTSAPIVRAHPRTDESQ